MARPPKRRLTETLALVPTAPLRAVDFCVDAYGGRALRCLWAVARQTIAEAVRMKLAIFFLVLLVLTFWAASRTEGDGTVSGRVQSFVTYSVTSAGVLLAVLSIFLSRSLSDELQQRQILMLMSKPLPRWQFLLGKWAGIVLLDAVLLAVTGLGVYLTATQYLARQTPLNDFDAGKLRFEVLTARHASPFVLPDFTREVNTLYARNLEEGVYDAIEDFAPLVEKDRLRKYLDGRWRNVPVGEERYFEFANVLCDRSEDSAIQIRYKAQANRYPPDEILRTQWIAGDRQKNTAIAATPRRDVIGRYHTIAFPADTVAPDHTLRVRFINVNPYAGEPQYDNRLFFEGPRGVEVLFQVGTFGGNLVRALVMVQCKLMFLAAVALMFATLFSFPVACFCSFITYLLAGMRQFIEDALGSLEAKGAVGLARAVISVMVDALGYVVPNFARYNPVELLADGRNVTLAWALQSVVYLVAIGAGVALLIACLFFYRREVSEVSV
ncbi:MAG TPA: ABC transporter permease [Phycisphaerae bacterium]|nr:ABC transporter permease [Phycisphaerae bacterium]